MTPAILDTLIGLLRAQRNAGATYLTREDVGSACATAAPMAHAGRALLRAVLENYELGGYVVHAGRYRVDALIAVVETMMRDAPPREGPG